ncbi:MAG: serine/threonine-protein kinase [Polyangiaceae bacterium]
MQLAPGGMVTPALRLVRHLDGGGMGQVWVADHAGLGRQVAVKIMSPAVVAVPGAAQRFAREASAAAQIHSPHVVQVYDQGVTADGMPFIVMELLEGEDLAHRLQRRGAMDPVTAALVVRQVASALERAHASGVVHRDVKPANVFLVDAGAETMAKVLDFGIAMQAEDVRVTSTGMMVGSPAYMSPEQVLDPRGVDRRCDLWALAVVAYECLTAILPFQADSVGALCIAIERSQFTPPTQRVPGLPPEVDAFFARALNRDAARRFPGAEALAAAFAQAIGVRFADGLAPSDPGAGASPSLAPPVLDSAADPGSSSRVTYVILGAVLSFCWLAAGTYTSCLRSASRRAPARRATPEARTPPTETAARRRADAGHRPNDRRRKPAVRGPAATVAAAGARRRAARRGADTARAAAAARVGGAVGRSAQPRMTRMTTMVIP